MWFQYIPTNVLKFWFVPGNSLNGFQGAGFCLLRAQRQGECNKKSKRGEMELRVYWMVHCKWNPGKHPNRKTAEPVFLDFCRGLESLASELDGGLCSRSLVFQWWWADTCIVTRWIEASKLPSNSLSSGPPILSKENSQSLRMYSNLWSASYFCNFSNCLNPTPGRICQPSQRRTLLSHHKYATSSTFHPIILLPYLF